VTSDDEIARLHDRAAAAQHAGDYPTLAQLARDLIALAQAAADRRELAWGHYFAGASWFQRSDGSAASREYRKALELFTEQGDREGRARSMLGMAAVALDIDLDVGEARRVYDLCVPIVRELGDKRRLGIVLGNFGEIHRMEGNADAALRCAREAVALFREAGDDAFAGWQLTSMGHYHLLRRDPESAIASMRQSYAELQKSPNPRWIAWYFDIWFIIAAALDRWDVAAQLMAFSNRYRDEHSVPRMPGILPWFSRPVESLSQRLGGDLETLIERGEGLDVAGAQALVEGVSVEAA